MTRSLASWAIVFAAVLAYPLAVLAPGGARFPSRSECIHPARRDDGNLEAVFGRFASQTAADPELARVLRLGFKGSRVEPDGCGYVKVVVHGIPTVAVGRGLVAEARGVGLHPTLEKIVR